MDDRVEISLAIFVHKDTTLWDALKKWENSLQGELERVRYTLGTGSVVGLSATMEDHMTEDPFVGDNVRL